MSDTTRSGWVTSGQKSKDQKLWKRRHNKKVRQSKNVADGGNHKKQSEQYNVREYRFLKR